jgi:thymidylate kinase
MKGKFIVIEGPDGSGKSTLAKSIYKYIGESRCLFTAEPSTGPLGFVLRDTLGGNVVLLPSVMERLFIADREMHCSGMIGPWLEKNNVVCDRYYYSTMVYQALESMELFESRWILDESGRFGTSVVGSLKDRFGEILDSHFYKTFMGRDTVVIRPDIAIVLVADPSVLVSRIKTRGGKKEIYDSDHRVSVVSAAYRLICQWIEEQIAKRNTIYPGECCPLIPGRQVVIDVSEKTEEEVFQEATKIIDTVIEADIDNPF